MHGVASFGDFCAVDDKLDFFAERGLLASFSLDFGLAFVSPEGPDIVRVETTVALRGALRDTVLGGRRLCVCADGTGTDIGAFEGLRSTVA